MTFEEMLEHAETVAQTLRDSGKFGGNVEVMKDDVSPGDPIPIAIEIDGEPFVLELNVM